MHVPDDIENPNNPGGGGAADLQAAAATLEPDVQSQFGVVFCLCCLACTVLAASAGLVALFYRSGHASTVVRVLAGFGLVVGIVGLVLGACLCAVTAHSCIFGNFEGTRQHEAPRVAA